MKSNLSSKFSLTLCISLLLLAWSNTSRAQTAPAEGAQQFAELGELKLRSGDTIQDFRIAYRTLGKLNSTKSNAVLWPTWLGGTTKDLLEFVGPGKVVDTSNYFVVLVDAIGDGVSSSPSNSKRQPLMKFPVFTIRDMVESQHRLLTEVLHITHLRAVMGMSMGGMQTFEWIFAFPDFMDLAIPVVGSPQSTSSDKLLWTTQIDALELDPAWNNGNPTGPLTRGFVISEEIGQMNLSSPTYRAAHTAPKEFEAFESDLKKKSVESGGAACDQIRQRQAIMALDIPSEYGQPLVQVAKNVRAKLLVIISPQDLMVNPIPAQRFAETIGVPIVSVDSPCGHIVPGCVSLGPTVAKFLADPPSVHSETLHDAGNH